MVSTVNTPSAFSMPVLSDERWAELRRRAIAAEEAERRRVVLDRLAHSGIPRAYRDASLSLCSEDVQQVARVIRHGEGHGYVFVGNVGRGKTYAACAVLRAFLNDRLGRFATTQHILEDVRATYSGFESEADVLSRYRNTKLLVLDDFGKEKPTEFALGKLFDIINHRINEQMPTIITTQYRGENLINRLMSGDNEDTAVGIVSRLAMFQRITFAGPDRRIG